MTQRQYLLFGQELWVDVGGELRHVSGNAAAVLVKLILARGTFVPYADIHAAVWHEVAKWVKDTQPPKKDIWQAVQSRVSGLRTTLGDKPGREAEVILQHGEGDTGGYRLKADLDDVDILRFEKMIDAARLLRDDPTNPDLQGAQTLLSSAFAMSAEPLGGLTTYPFIATEIARLKQLRKEAGRQLFEVHTELRELAAQRDLLGELIRLYPDDEEFRAADNVSSFDDVGLRGHTAYGYNVCTLIQGSGGCQSTDLVTTQTPAVTGSFANFWTWQGRENGPLGYPTNMVSPDARGGQWQSFEKGFIFTNPDPKIAGGGVFSVTGSFANLWTANGRENGPLGYPTNMQSDLPSGGTWQSFEKGYIFSNPHIASGTPYAVTGHISDTWNAQGRENGTLGWPTSQTLTCSTNSADTYQPFQGGVVTVDGAGHVTVNPPSPCPGTNLTVNGGFDTPSGTGPTSITANPGVAGGWTAAKNWAVMINTPTTTTTNLQPSSRTLISTATTSSTRQAANPHSNKPSLIAAAHYSSAPSSAGSSMLHICSTGADNGIAQVFAPQPGGGPIQAVVNVWVYVERGQIGVGVGDGGSTGVTGYSTTTGQWQLITTTSNAGHHANEIIIASVGTAGACYDLDSVTIQAQPSI